MGRMHVINRHLPREGVEPEEQLAMMEAFGDLLQFLSQGDREGISAELRDALAPVLNGVSIMLNIPPFPLSAIRIK